jgi:hypothetical protein
MMNQRQRRRNKLVLAVATEWSLSTRGENTHACLRSAAAIDNGGAMADLYRSKVEQLASALQREDARQRRSEGLSIRSS